LMVVASEFFPGSEIYLLFEEEWGFTSFFWAWLKTGISIRRIENIWEWTEFIIAG